MDDTNNRQGLVPTIAPTTIDRRTGGAKDMRTLHVKTHPKRNIGSNSTCGRDPTTGRRLHRLRSIQRFLDFRRIRLCCPLFRVAFHSSDDSFGVKCPIPEAHRGCDDCRSTLHFALNDLLYVNMSYLDFSVHVVNARSSVSNQIPRVVAAGT